MSACSELSCTAWLVLLCAVCAPLMLLTPFGAAGRQHPVPQPAGIFGKTSATPLSTSSTDGAQQTRTGRKMDTLPRPAMQAVDMRDTVVYVERDGASGKVCRPLMVGVKGVVSEMMATAAWTARTPLLAACPVLNSPPLLTHSTSSASAALSPDQYATPMAGLHSAREYASSPEPGPTTTSFSMARCNEQVLSVVQASHRALETAVTSALEEMMTAIEAGNQRSDELERLLSEVQRASTSTPAGIEDHLRMLQASLSDLRATVMTLSSLDAPAKSRNTPSSATGHFFVSCFVHVTTITHWILVCVGMATLAHIMAGAYARASSALMWCGPCTDLIIESFNGRMCMGRWERLPQTSSAQRFRPWRAVDVLSAEIQVASRVSEIMANTTQDGLKSVLNMIDEIVRKLSSVMALLELPQSHIHLMPNMLPPFARAGSLTMEESFVGSTQPFMGTMSSAGPRGFAQPEWVQTGFGLRSTPGFDYQQVAATSGIMPFSSVSENADSFKPPGAADMASKPAMAHVPSTPLPAAAESIVDTKKEKANKTKIATASSSGSMQTWVKKEDADNATNELPKRPASKIATRAMKEMAPDEFRMDDGDDTWDPHDMCHQDHVDNLESLSEKTRGKRGHKSRRPY